MKTSILITACLASTLMLASCGKKEATAPVKEAVKTETQKVVTEAKKMAEPMTVKTLPALADPNTASLEEMLALPGMPENIPAMIIENRPFDNAQALDAFLNDHTNIPTKNAIYRQAFIPMPLNTTPEADFRIIPGVNKKMAHEFEEYRPYTDWNQFNREIGKYVDADEVARLRRYVTLD